MNVDEVMKDYRKMDSTQILHAVQRFREVITKAPTGYFVTCVDDEDPRQIADESIMALWGTTRDNMLSLVVYEWAKGVFFRTDDTLHYIFNDSDTAFVWVCEYCGYWDGKQVFHILDINKMGGE
jgi:hypothetical protein